MPVSIVTGLPGIAGPVDDVEPLPDQVVMPRELRR
jgi:hypothetical protein